MSPNDFDAADAAAMERIESAPDTVDDEPVSEPQEADVPVSDGNDEPTEQATEAPPEQQAEEPAPESWEDRLRKEWGSEINYDDVVHAARYGASAMQAFQAYPQLMDMLKKLQAGEQIEQQGQGQPQQQPQTQQRQGEKKTPLEERLEKLEARLSKADEESEARRRDAAAKQVRDEAQGVIKGHSVLSKFKDSPERREYFEQAALLARYQNPNLSAQQAVDQAAKIIDGLAEERAQQILKSKVEGAQNTTAPSGGAATRNKRRQFGGEVFGGDPEATKAFEQQISERIDRQLRDA